MDRARPVLGAVAVLTLTVAISWWRLGDIAPHVMWAEDGRNFLQDAIDRPGPRTWFAPYAGYLHLLPRMAASVVVMLTSVPDYAVAVTFISVVIAGLIAVAVWFAAGTVIAQPAARLAIALVPALLPIAPREVSGNLANLHWYALWGAGWLLVARPASRAVSWTAAAVVLVLALTEVQTLFLVPAALVALLSPPRRPPAAALVVGAAAQWLSRHVSPPRGDFGGEPLSAYDHVVGFAGQVLAGAFWPRGVPVWETWVVVVLIGSWGLMLLATLRWARPVERMAVITLSVGAIALHVVAFRVNRPGGMNFASWSPQQWADVLPARYAVVPAAMVMVTVIVALTTLGRRRPRMAVAAASVAACVVVVGGLDLPTSRDAGPRWPTAQQWVRFCPDGGGRRVVAIAPVTAANTWTIDVPCARV